MTIPIAITGIGPICSEAFCIAELLAVGGAPGSADATVRPMAHFEPERFLGKRGFKFLSAGTRYALAASWLALEDADLRDTPRYAPESKGVFMGTNFAAHDVVEAMDAVVLSQGSSALLAIETPNFSVNIAASYVSQKCGFEAFNVTLTNMLVAGLEAVMLGAQSIQSGRAQLVLAGAAEGPIPAHAAAVLGEAPSEGAACMLTLEALPEARARGARVYAQVGAHALCFIPPDAADTVRSWQPHEERLRRHLDALLGDRPVSTVTMPALDSTFSHRVNEALLRHVQDRRVTVLRAPISAVPADACVSPLLWLAASVARHGEGALLIASPQGHVALLSLEPVGSPVAAAARERGEHTSTERTALV